jgi:hypothetical protein
MAEEKIVEYFVFVLTGVAFHLFVLTLVQESIVSLLEELI